VTTDTIQTRFARRMASIRWTPRLEIAGFAIALVLTALSAILVKESGGLPPLAAIEPAANAQPIPPTSEIESEPVPDLPEIEVTVEPVAPEVASEVRYFNGRPIRPAGTIRMRVTAYSPHAPSCGEFADGQTATLHSVTTNAGKLVAADPALFPYGTLLSVPGYDQGRVVPVLDCGGAIKGRRLDVLYPTHKSALQWGVQDLEVTIWEYADGKPADDPRDLR